MANRRFNQRNVRKITRSGSSLNVSIPVEFLSQLGWKEKQKVMVKKIRGGVAILDWKP
ncbi:MAG: hypothetical protein HY395_02085 [Candidatus Doudnabacteria bacterium]|nr:hypothetical protein [Candidatus Doudnabacteria bacterium]